MGNGVPILHWHDPHARNRYPLILLISCISSKCFFVSFLQMEKYSFLRILFAFRLVVLSILTVSLYHVSLIITNRRKKSIYLLTRRNSLAISHLNFICRCVFWNASLAIVSKHFIALTQLMVYAWLCKSLADVMPNSSSPFALMIFIAWLGDPVASQLQKAPLWIFTDVRSGIHANRCWSNGYIASL